MPGIPSRHLIRDVPSRSAAISSGPSSHRTPANPSTNIIHCFATKYKPLSKASSSFHCHQHRIPDILRYEFLSHHRLNRLQFSLKPSHSPPFSTSTSPSVCSLPSPTLQSSTSVSSQKSSISSRPSHFHNSHHPKPSTCSSGSSSSAPPHPAPVIPATNKHKQESNLMKG